MSISRRELLATGARALGGAFLAGATLGLPRLEAGAASASCISFFLVGDTHYCADDVETGAMKISSMDKNARLIDWLNKLPGSQIPREAGGGTVALPHGVIHAGDLIDNGDKAGARYAQMAETETGAFTADWGLNGGDAKLRWPVREVHGNHDSPVGDGPSVSAIRARNKRRKGLTNLSQNGLHYSWDWGETHFVALGIVVGGAKEVTRKRRYAPLESLPFLAEDLASNVGRSGRPVVLVHHVDVARYSTQVADEVAEKNEWDYGDVRAYYETLKRYHVVATLYGHTHVRNIFRWDGTREKAETGGIIAVNTDNAAHYREVKQAFLYVEIDQRELRIREVFTEDSWLTADWTPETWRFPLSV